MLKYFINTLLMGLLTCVIVFPPAKAAEKTFAPIPIATRYVTLYRELENELQNAVAKGDPKKIQALLGENFEEYTAGDLQEPISRSIWLKIMQKHPEWASRRMEQVAARDLGNIVIVSYKWTGSKQNMFIVDVWKNDENNSQLIARYSAGANSPDFAYFK